MHDSFFLFFSTLVYFQGFLLHYHVTIRMILLPWELFPILFLLFHLALSRCFAFRGGGRWVNATFKNLQISFL